MIRVVQTDIGSIRIAAEAVAALAGAVASECPGVAGMAARSLQDGLAGMLGRESHGRGVEVNADEDGRVWLRLGLVVHYGERVTAVAAEVRRRVKEAVETATGVEVGGIEVRVEGIQLPRALARRPAH